MHPAKLLGPPKPSLDNSSISPRGLGGRWKFSESGISIDHVWVDIGYQLSFEVMAELRVGHQTASQYSNYNGSLLFHLAEAFHARHSTIVERPAPAEVGGFAIRLDDEFSTAFANAEAIPESIAVTETGYRSLLGRVDGNLYVGRTAAGGMGSRIDLDNDGKTDVSFSSPWKAFTVLPSYGVKVDFYCVLTAGIYKGMNSNVVTHDCL